MFSADFKWPPCISRSECDFAQEILNTSPDDLNLFELKKRCASAKLILEDMGLSDPTEEPWSCALHEMAVIATKD